MATQGDRHRIIHQCIDAWRDRGRIPTPSPSGGILDMLIIHLIEVTAIDGMPIDLVVEARASKRAPYKRFAVVFSEQRPGACFRPEPRRGAAAGHSRERQERRQVPCAA